MCAGVAEAWLHRAEVESEAQLLFVGQFLIVEHQHAVFVHAGGDGGDFGIGQGLGAVDAADFADE